MSHALEAWRAAEAAIGAPDAVDAAAATLPPALAALLRALEALDAGEPAAIAALAARLRPDHRDLAAVLEVAVAPRGPVDTALWADLDESVELPLRDLLAAYAVAREGRPAVPSARLAEEAGYRPLLHGAFRLLTDDRSEVYTNPLVRAVSPRAEELHMAACAWQLVGHTARGLLAAHRGAPLTLRLEPPRWEELSEDLPPGDLLRWARTRAPWIDAHDASVDAALLGPAASLPPLVGTLLRRIARDLPQGRVAGLTRPVRAVVRLAWAAPLPRTLQLQLGALQLRLDRPDPQAMDPHARLLTGLWARRARLTPDEQRVVATALVATPGALAPEVLQSAVTVVMARAEQAELAGELLLERAARRPPAALLDDLRGAGASAHRLRHLAALHAAANGYVLPALRALPLLVGPGAHDGPAATQVLRTALGALSRREHLPDDVLAALHAALDALATAPLGPAPWGAVAADPRWREVPSEDVRARALAAADLHATTPESLAATLALIRAWGDAEALRAAVVHVGRRLRALPPDEADDLALGVLAWTFTWSGAAAREGVAGALRPLSRFLLRDHGAPAAAASARLPPGPAVAGAVDWWLHEGQDATRAGAWRHHLAGLLTVPPRHRALFRDLVLSTDLSQARGLPAAAAALQAALSDALAALPPEPLFVPLAVQAGPAPLTLDDVPYDPPTTRCLPPLHLDARRLVSDPAATLGLPPGPHDAEAVRAAWRACLRAHPPEQEPERARAAREARDRLLDPERVLDRELGVLHVPDPEAWALPDSRGPTATAHPSPESRLLGQAVLYTLLEEWLWTDGVGAAVAEALSTPPRAQVREAPTSDGDAPGRP